MSACDNCFMLGMLKSEVSRLQSLPELAERDEARKLREDNERLRREIENLKAKLNESLRPYTDVISELKCKLREADNINYINSNEIESLKAYQNKLLEKANDSDDLKKRINRLEEEAEELRKNGGYTDYDLLLNPEIRKERKRTFRNEMAKAIEEDPNIPIYTHFVKMLIDGNGFKMGTTFTYVIRGAADCVYKIGKSKNPWKRVTNIADERGEDLCIFAISPFDVETSCHRYYSKFRVKGMYDRSSEWFNLGQNPMDMLKADSEKNGWGFCVLPQPISTTRNGTV